MLLHYVQCSQALQEFSRWQRLNASECLARGGGGNATSVSCNKELKSGQQIQKYSKGLQQLQCVSLHKKQLQKNKALKMTKKG